MGGEQSRRRFLSAGVAIGVAPLVGRWSTARRNPTNTMDSQSNTLEIESDGGGVAAYEFTVNGSLSQADSDDGVDGNRAYGHVGPKRGTDTFTYSGEITGFVLAGPASAYRNGSWVGPSWFPHPAGSPTSADFSPDSGTNVLRVESDGGGTAAYEFDVTDSLAQRDSDDDVDGNRAYGHVGPKRGADEFEFTGDVTRFDLAGPASVYLNGSKVTAGSGGSDADRRLVRAAPARETTAAPDSTVLFEAVAPGHPDEFLSADWYVDGQEWVDPGAFYGHLGGRGRAATTYRFEDEGTHEVRLEAHERADGGETGDRIGEVRWTVEVGPDGNRPPSVELTAPDEPISVGESPERRTFEVTASDSGGNLDRVVWWQSQCDALVGVSNVSGERDTATLSFAPDSGCPLGVRAIDADGSVSDLIGWEVE